jgi:hypothetical protein
MKNIYYCFALLLACMLCLSGCGGGSGAPGSSDSADTGIIIQSAVVSSDNIDIDTHIHACSETTVEEGLFRENATLDVSAAKLVPGSVDDPLAAASIEECTITYKKANEDPAAPIIESWTIYPNCPLVNGTSSCSISLIDIERKVRWWNDYAGGTFTPSEYPTHYVASYTCKYVSTFGETGYFQAELDIWLADFDLC